MSTFFLSLTNADSESQGTLKIVHTVWPSGDVTQGWTWLTGGPHGLDGGTWTWKDGQADPGRGSIKMDLVSLQTHRVVGHVFESNWDNGPTPPATPWFSRQGGDKTFRYSASPDGILRVFFWELTK
jgi:hypothetical protein